jgi:hypothetical protein
MLVTGRAMREGRRSGRESTTGLAWGLVDATYAESYRTLIVITEFKRCQIGLLLLTASLLGRLGVGLAVPDRLVVSGDVGLHLLHGRFHLQGRQDQVLRGS